MEQGKLKRTVGLVSATSIGLGAMLGAGIFVFPGLAGGQAGAAAIFSFLIGGVIALLVSACTAELATAMPQSGGGYYFVSRSFGKLSGTLVGISQWIGLIFACSFYLVSFGEYAVSFLDELGVKWSTSTTVFSFVFTLILLGINILGTKKVGRVQNVMVISLAIMLVLIFTYGLIDYLGIEKNGPANDEVAPGGLGSVLTTTALIFTSYLGFLQIANLGSEIKSPVKNLPRSLIGSVIIAALAYVFIIFVCTLSFPYEELRNYGETATIEVARKLLGNWGAVVVVLAAVLAALSSANASMISASRGVFALSKDEVITPKASRVNRRFGTPHIALILVAVPIFIMLARSELEVFAEVASFLHLIIYAGICLSVLKLRASEPSWYFPTFRVPAHKLVAGLGAVCCIALIFFMQTASILIGLGVITLALLYHLLYVKKKGLSLSTPQPPHIDTDLLHPRVLIPVDLSKDRKGLPVELVKAVPISEILLLGFQATPEQTHSEQSREEFQATAEEKLKAIKDELKEANSDFRSEFIFGENVASQIESFIAEEKLQFILTLKPLASLEQVLVPIYDASQINTQVGTIVHSLCANTDTTVKVLLFSDNNDSEVDQLKAAVNDQFKLVDVRVDAFDVHEGKDDPFDEVLKNTTKKSDLVVLAEAAETDRDALLNFVMEKEQSDLKAPMIMILRADNSSSGNK